MISINRLCDGGMRFGESYIVIALHILPAHRDIVRFIIFIRHGITDRNLKVP